MHPSYGKKHIRHRDNMVPTNENPLPVTESLTMEATSDSVSWNEVVSTNFIYCKCCLLHTKKSVTIYNSRMIHILYMLFFLYTNYCYMLYYPWIFVFCKWYSFEIKFIVMIDYSLIYIYCVKIYTIQIYYL